MKHFVAGVVVATCLFTALEARAKKHEYQVTDPFIKAYSEFATFAIFEDRFYYATKNQAHSLENKIKIRRFLEKCIMFSKTETSAQHFKELYTELVGTRK